MFEPFTLTLAELAARWNLTPRQILQRAQQLGVPLHFHFEGLVFDVNDEWHRANGDWLTTQEFDGLKRGIDCAKDQLQRRARGQLSEFEQLSSEDAAALRRKLEDQKLKFDWLAQLLKQRNTERNRHDYRGFLRAAPSTLWDIETLGCAPFPHKAFDPSCPVKLMPLTNGPSREGKQVWSGHLVSLEPMTGHDNFTKNTLTAEDLVAFMSEVKVIEKYIKTRETNCQTAEITSPEPCTEPNVPPANTSAFSAPIENEESPAIRREKLDIQAFRGTRRRILEKWNDIEKEYGPNPIPRQVLRVLKRDIDEEPIELKTVQNHLAALRREKLIP